MERDFKRCVSFPVKTFFLEKIDSVELTSSLQIKKAESAEKYKISIEIFSAQNLIYKKDWSPHILRDRIIHDGLAQTFPEIKNYISSEHEKERYRILDLI